MNARLDKERLRGFATGYRLYTENQFQDSKLNSLDFLHESLLIVLPRGKR